MFVFVVVVNALNLIDGLDGMASFISIKFFLIVGGIVLVSKTEFFFIFSNHYQCLAWVFMV
jgi:UDP-N-acetylmuramyl pentapeptide phosphotransferase/UDP-N-acetylglucosamine-1-phosphate transferase